MVCYSDFFYCETLEKDTLSFGDKGPELEQYPQMEGFDLVKIVDWFLCQNSG